MKNTFKTMMDLFKRATISIASILLGSISLLLLVIFGIASMESPYSTESETFHIESSISMQSRQLAFQPMIIAPYKTMEVFISAEHEADFEFTSVGGSWQEVLPPGTKIEAEVQFKVDGQWSEWLDMEEEVESEYENKKEKYAMASSNPANAMKYKYIMYGDGVSAPIVNNPEWTFIRAEKSLTIVPTPTPQYSSAPLSSMPTYLALTSSNSNITSRSTWGANESYRYLANNDAEAILITLGDDFYEQFKEELVLSKVVEADKYGKKYVWPLQYPQKVKKVIIHHTATTKELDNPSQAIRDIYYYHSVTKGWGDIGYNYIIDKNGKVYEGRYGGEGVIGAHAGPGNNGSIGIAVLGNYEQNEVPEKVISSISTLIAQKARIHGFNPEGYSIFRGKNMANIFAHKDIMSTTCPGAHLYAKIPVIRKLAAARMQEAKPRFVKDYDYIDMSDIFYVEMTPSEIVDVKIEMENIGKVDWNSETFIVVNTNPEFNGVISFPGSGEVVLATMNESLVKPGAVATFNFKIKAGSNSKLVNMDIAPIVNGTKKIDDYKVLPISVQQNNFKYEFVDMEYPPSGIDGGTDLSLWVKLRNSGNSIWRKSGDNTVVLGTDHERDRFTRFLPPGTTRLGGLEEDEVRPGEIGTFRMNLKAPTKAGYYKEYFTPVVEGQTWMEDSGMYFETTVFGDLYASEVVSWTSANKWKQGEKYVIWIKIRNLGKATWRKEDMDLVFLREQDLKVTSARLASEEVEPGEVGTISFVVEVDENEDIERKAMMVRPKIDGNHLYPRPIYFYYNVIENTGLEPIKASTTTIKPTVTDTVVQAATGEEGDIRIRLGFVGNPQITANGSFTAYSGTERITTLSSGSIGKVSYTNGKYQLTANGKTYLKSSPIRFIPSSGIIMEIDNYINPPGWNPDLNDNQYRGTLEVNYVDSELIVINELPLEAYLKGIGEVSNSEEPEKIKAVMTAARSYAKYYMDIASKFPGKPYHLNDDPEASQKYIGYGLEKRSPNVASAVEATDGQVVTYKGTLIKTPYFNQSDGVATKSAKDVWNWDAPYLISVNDGFCDGTVFLGHGVGMSGCGAKGMAKSGYGYISILKYYYSGTEVTKMY